MKTLSIGNPMVKRFIKKMFLEYGKSYIMK